MSTVHHPAANRSPYLQIHWQVWLCTLPISPCSFMLVCMPGKGLKQSNDYEICSCLELMLFPKRCFDDSGRRPRNRMSLDSHQTTRLETWDSGLQEERMTRQGGREEVDHLPLWIAGACDSMSSFFSQWMALIRPVWNDNDGTALDEDNEDDTCRHGWRLQRWLHQWKA